MKRRLRIAIFSGLYILFLVAFFGISNALGWDIKPEPRVMGYFIALYIGGLVPMWAMKSGKKEDKEIIVDWDKEMERRRKMGEERKKAKGKS